MTAKDPFFITGPAVISFSGGRTSAYMLWRVLQAHGGKLPDDVVVCFANTGREMPATLDFVQECATRWGVHVVWLEFTGRAKDGFKVVSHNEAARNGEPFEALLAAQSSLPNPVQRSCTTEMKIRTIKRWVMATLGWKHWTNVVGIRADEPQRLESAKAPAAVPSGPDLLGAGAKAKPRRTRRDRWKLAYPLATGGIALPDVQAFWKAQPFDLDLAGPWEGNCDLCFLKSRPAIMRMQRDYPERATWWPAMEGVPRGKAGRGRTFRRDREPYAVLAHIVANTPMLPFDETMIEGGEACGVWCGA